MKCPKCNGKGKFIGYYVNDNPVECECVICNGTGEVQMTNEEYLRSCTTEEMAKTILDLCDDRPCFACGIGYCDDESWCHVYSDEAKEFVMEWLKQPHQKE